MEVVTLYCDNRQQLWDVPANLLYPATTAEAPYVAQRHGTQLTADLEVRAWCFDDLQRIFVL